MEDLARLLGKSRFEVERMLNDSDVIELNLSERQSRKFEERDDLRIVE